VAYGLDLFMFCCLVAYGLDLFPPPTPDFLFFFLRRKNKKLGGGGDVGGWGAFGEKWKLPIIFNEIVALG
jgi:hypothetical protein